MTRTTPELAPSLQTSVPHQRKDVCPPTYDLTCNRLNTRRIFGGIGFRTCNPPATSRHLTNRSPHWNPSETGQHLCCVDVETGAMHSTKLYRSNHC
ncbi:hypothetical protein AVEN_10724-1 [Araneus ventricosus]|uniref:Uncharacterized protein n=1 Tax=Araneus ventricosus TaxID=182803 RepID=A0A4Y2G0M7_ARAVE|nr:hypothetical protein AVEN_10724-1 [Araneus ventricosus]